MHKRSILGPVSTPPKIAVWTYFNVSHVSKTCMVFSPADDEATWSLLHFYFLWHSGVVVITTAQFNLTKTQLRFCIGSNPARSVSEICDGQNLTVIPAGNKA